MKMINKNIKNGKDYYPLSVIASICYTTSMGRHYVPRGIAYKIKKTPDGGGTMTILEKTGRPSQVFFWRVKLEWYDMNALENGLNDAKDLVKAAINLRHGNKWPAGIMQEFGNATAVQIELPEHRLNQNRFLSVINERV